MKSKNIVIVLFIVLAASVAYLLWMMQKKKSQQQSMEPVGADPLQPIKVPPTLINSTPAPSQPLPPGLFPLKYGSRGKAVQMIQVIVGVNPDGIWGANTNEAILRILKDAEITLFDFLLYVSAAAQKDIANFPLKVGSRGNYVKALQILLDQKIDGTFGANTQAALNKKLGINQITVEGFQGLVKKILSST